MKRCSKCKVEKELSEFHKDKSRKDGLFSYCKGCTKAHVDAYKTTNRARVNASARDYHYRNRDASNARHNAYYVKNRKEINRRSLERRRNSPEELLKHSLRNRLIKALRSRRKVGSAIRDVGCTVQELRLHIESQFTGNMSWQNYGLRTDDGWSIDHILPLAAFDLTNRDEFLKASHYTNLRPMQWKQNIEKNDKIDGVSVRIRDCAVAQAS